MDVAFCVDVFGGVAVAVGGTTVAVFVGVAVGEDVAVAVEVFVGVAVAVGGTAVAVAVAVGVAICLPSL